MSFNARREAVERARLTGSEQGHVVIGSAAADEIEQADVAAAWRKWKGWSGGLRRRGRFAVARGFGRSEFKSDLMTRRAHDGIVEHFIAKQVRGGERNGRAFGRKRRGAKLACAGCKQRDQDAEPLAGGEIGVGRISRESTGRVGRKWPLVTSERSEYGGEQQDGADHDTATDAAPAQGGFAKN